MPLPRELEQELTGLRGRITALLQGESAAALAKAEAKKMRFLEDAELLYESLPSNLKQLLDPVFSEPIRQHRLELPKKYYRGRGSPYVYIKYVDLLDPVQKDSEGYIINTPAIAVIMEPYGEVPSILGGDYLMNFPERNDYGGYWRERGELPVCLLPFPDRTAE